MAADQTPAPGQRWIDRRPMTDNRKLRDRAKYRRIVEVTAVGSEFELPQHRTVRGISFWQERINGGEWRDVSGIGARRTVGIHYGTFVRRFDPADPQEA